MTRQLHEETDTQRGDRAAANVSDEAKQRGYEPADAPPKGVAFGMAGLAMLMVVALFACAGLLRLLAKDEPPPGAANVHVEPPPPRLETRLIENEAPPTTGSKPPPAAIRRGMTMVEGRGWGETAPAPPPHDAARAHVETPR